MSLSTYETKCSHLAEIEEKKRQSDCKQEGHQQLVIELRFHPEQHSLLFSHWGMVITFFHRSANPKIQKAHHSHNSKGYLLLFSCVKDLVLAKLGGGDNQDKNRCVSCQFVSDITVLVLIQDDHWWAIIYLYCNSFATQITIHMGEATLSNTWLTLWKSVYKPKPNQVVYFPNPNLSAAENVKEKKK